MMAFTRLRHRERGTGLVEYGLVLGAVAVLIIAGLNSLRQAQAGYFSSLGRSVAAAPAAPITGPHHSTSVDQPLCTPATAGDPFTCTTYVHDTSDLQLVTGHAAPTGTVTWLADGTAVMGQCVALTPAGADVARCQSSLTRAQPGSVNISAAYNPGVSDDFLASVSPPLLVTVVAPTPTPTPTPTATPTPLPTPTPTPTPRDRDERGASPAMPQE